VGSDHLEAAIDSMNLYGRIVVCGQISQYNSLRPSPAPRNLGLIVPKRFSLRGMLAQDHLARQRDFLAEVAPLVLTGQLKYAETVAEGIESAPQAFLDLMSGANTGKMLVRVG
ncbi:MAG: zinc-binding dehydrogenase, partial [Acidimicrobiales bacterium]